MSYIYLLLSIVCSSLLIIIFKYFPKYKINNLQAVVVNYLTCALIGSLFVDFEGFSLNNFVHQPYFYVALLLGSLFIIIFNLLGITSQKFNASVASISMKLALIAPVCMAFLFYGEEINTKKIIGVILALVAVFLSSIKEKKEGEPHHKISEYALPLIVFLGSGVCDSLVQFAEQKYFQHGGFELFAAFLFVVPFVLGFFFVLTRILLKKDTFSPRSILAGIILGIPNYGSIYFLIKSLNQWESSVIFPVNNLGIVLLTSMMGWLLFREKQSKVNMVGIGLASVSLLLLAFA